MPMVLSWLEFATSIYVFLFLSQRTRRLVRHNAPFYARSNILIVGSVFGVTGAVIAHFISRLISPSIFVLGALTLWGLLSVLYMGYNPDPIDWANKAGQTSYVAAAIYIVASGLLLFLA
jgi:hypothetical protein